MATSSTEASTSLKPYRVHNKLLNQAKEKIWNADIVATASTNGFWEPDKEFNIKVKINELKRKFHQNRYLHLKHLPRDVTEREIQQMLSDFPISCITLLCGHGSAGSAKAFLEDPEMLEEWDGHRTFLLRGQKIPVGPTVTEYLLCVARLPIDFTESQFESLFVHYGKVRMCFLMISEKTGESKGYGFVEFTCKEDAAYAKTCLDRAVVKEFILHVDFVDQSFTTFESLHSRCLFVDNLPSNYRDLGEFRKIFSKVVNPPYCQIALKNGCPQNWGIVEFNSGEDAEATLALVNGTDIKNRRLRITYYIPGIRAINLYLKLLNDVEGPAFRGNGVGLLPDPPAPTVLKTLRNLRKQNPFFAQSLHNIMVSEILGSNGTQSENEDPNPDPIFLAPQANGPNPPADVPQNPPSIPSLDTPLVPATATSTHGEDNRNWTPHVVKFSNNTLNGPVLPEGVATPASTQMPAQGTEGIQQPVQFVKRPEVANNAAKELTSAPAQQTQTPAAYWNQMLKTSEVEQSAPVPAVEPEEQIMGARHQFPGVAAFAQHPAPSVVPPSVPSVVVPEMVAPQRLIPQPAPFPWFTQPVFEQPYLVPSIKGATAAAVALNQNAVLQYLQASGMVGVEKHQQHLMTVNDSISQWLGTLVSKPGPANIQITTNINTDTHHNNSTQNVLKQPQFLERSPSVQSNTHSITSSSSGCSSMSSTASRFSDTLDSEIATEIPIPPPPTMWQTPPRAFPFPPPRPVGFESRKRQEAARQATPPGNWLKHFTSPPPVTPVGLKRKHTRILPSPEPSPEGNYIGQHSQGIGGHYADSYFKRKRKY